MRGTAEGGTGGPASGEGSERDPQDVGAERIWGGRREA